MFLYLVRHGEAKPETEDPARGLTDKGFRDVSLTALYVHDRDIKPDVIYHSGRKRAQQTAQIFSDYLKPVKGVIEADSLAPMDDPAVWAGRISGMRENIMLVGHLPYLARLAGWLLCGDKEKLAADFKTGGIACFERLSDGRWIIAWMLAPAMLS